MSTIESLELEIKSNSQSAVNGIDALTDSLEKLRNATKGGLGLSAISKQIRNLNDVTIDKGKVKSLVDALEPLSKLPKSNLSSFITPLKKIPEVLSELNKIDMSALSAKMQEVATAVKPLADEMQKVSNGFSAMPAKIQKLLTATNKIPSTNKKASVSFTDIYHKLKSVANIVTKVGKKIYSMVEKSMDFIENMNLFEVSMGKYAGNAYEYAEHVSDVLGIDTSEWIRAQGVFMTLATGFGVAGDRAETMSKNLTQLGYDLSSFYNISTEDAMQKLQSGLSGELEPLRRLGYDLSQAKLEATALELGITKSVSAMTQAEKAQLRYYAIMTQVTQTHGDMARTLDDPANQMRVFKAQINMAAREIGNVFIPALNAILPYGIAVAKVIGTIASGIASLFGYEKATITDTTDTLVENTSSVAENMEDAQEEAKKLKSYMLGIDELNVINPNEGSAIEDTSGWVDFALPDYSEKFLEGAAESRVNEIVGKMKEWLGITEEINSWSDLLATNFGNILATVGLIAIGLVAWKISTLAIDVAKVTQLLSGIGVMLKAMGAAAVIATAVVGAKWLIDNTEDTMTKIGAIISGAALAVGAILAFTGINLPLGIALMAVGALSMGTAIAMNTDKLSDEVKGVIASITSVVSVALLGVGAVLAFSGVNIPLGIALMAGGAITMATAIIPKWDTLSDSVKTTISSIMAILGGAFLVLGAILAFTGVALPLGIGLMLVGAASLGTAVALNWNAIVDALRGPVGLITGILGGALLVLGAILLFTGVGIPLGIGLMLAGAAGLGAAIAPNWDFLVDKIKGVWDKIKTFWNTNIAPVFTREWWANLGKKCVNGLIGAFEWGLNKIVGGLNTLLGVEIDIPAILGGGSISLGFQIPEVSLDRFAEGGFPKQGQMFIAREAGAEMVGSIGRRTAVANNDQIVESVAGGVAEANEEQNALLREQNSLLRALLDKESGVYLDGKYLANSVEKHQRERGRVLITGGVV